MIEFKATAIKSAKKVEMGTVNTQSTIVFSKQVLNLGANTTVEKLENPASKPG